MYGARGRIKRAAGAALLRLQGGTSAAKAASIAGYLGTAEAVPFPSEIICVEFRSGIAWWNQKGGWRRPGFPEA